jgi:hypothetical protein
MFNKINLKNEQNWRNQILQLNATDVNFNAWRQGKEIFSAQKLIVE